MAARRMLAIAVFVTSAFIAAAIPAAAKDSYLFASPFVMEVSGAGGASRTFMVPTNEDTAVEALIRQLSASLAQASPTTIPWQDAPHYQFAITRMAGRPYGLPWFLDNSVEFAYYPTIEGSGLLMVRIDRSGPVTAWQQAEPSVVAFLRRHTQGLPPAGSTSGFSSPSSIPWELVAATLLVVGALATTRLLQRQSLRPHPFR